MAGKQQVIFLPGPAGPAGAGENNEPLISQGDAEAGTQELEKSWSALRVAQAIAALETGGGGGGISMVGVPATDGAAGTVGQFSYDGFYVYMAVADAEWVRWAHQSTFTS